LLLVAGLVIAGLGIAYVGGWSPLLEALPEGFLRPLPAFNESPAFNFVGIFWQDGLAGGVAFYFLNQGMLMRFLSSRTVATGRRAAVSVLLILMPVAAIAVSGARWIGTAMVGRGDLPADTRPDEAFVVVTRALCIPGIFGAVMAALLAALMSTVDTLINASSALLVNDIYRPLLRPGRDERHYLRVARWMSLAAALAGLALVPLYGSFDTIYEAHGAFIAAVTPPLAVALLLALVWRRFTPAAALATLVGGTVLMFVSLAVPSLVLPFSHGIPPDGGYKYIRACYGVAVSGALAVGVTWLTSGRSRRGSDTLTVHGLRGRRPSPSFRRRRFPARARALATPMVTPSGEPAIVVERSTLARLGGSEGDIVFVDDARWWLGGLRSARGRLVAGPEAIGEARSDSELPAVGLARETLERNGWRDGQRIALEAGA
jgi:SSS family solute:Na+ symporter